MKSWFLVFYTIVILAASSSSCYAIPSEGETSTPSPSNPSVSVLSSTTAPTSNFDFTCWPVKPLEKGNGITGGILYSNFPYDAKQQEVNGFFVWNLNTFQSIPVKSAPHELQTGEMYSSSNGKLVALTSDNSLLIISQDGTQSFPLPIENLKIRTYLPDGRVLLDLVSMPDYQEGKGLTDLYYVFDPVTGKTTKHSVFLPNFVPGKDLWTLQYSPNMKYILYRSSPGENNVQFTLYDLERNEVVWVGPPRDSRLTNVAIPAWRPDSSGLTTIYMDATGYRNYYSISLDGKVSVMNSFNGAELDTITRSNIWWDLDLADFANWSPNGQYLASLGHPKSDYKDLPSLFIWDDQEKMLYKPCVPAEGDRISTQYNVIWSYDGSHALVSFTLLQTPTPVEVLPGIYAPDYVSKDYILDLANRVIYAAPNLTDKDVFTYDKDGYNLFLNWVNWEIP